MLNISGPDKKLTDIEVKEFLERQRHNIKSVVEDVLDEKVMPRLDTLESEIKETKAASQSAHTQILDRLERIDKRLDQMDKRFDHMDKRLDDLEN